MDSVPAARPREHYVLARALHLSPRAVGYRLQRITQLTGHSPYDPEGRFVLELAVRARPLIATNESQSTVPDPRFVWDAAGVSAL